jgi:4-hydroxy-2-oxoheptanedioate aldolase
VDDEQPEPRGQRGFGGVPGAWGLNTEDYVQKADLWPLDPNGELLLIVQFETAAAIDDMEAILSVPGVGAGFLGPADLHADMGYLGQFGGVPEVAEKIAQAGATARDMGAYLGIIGNASSWEDLADQGFMFISGGDVGLSQALSTDLESLGR